MIGAAARNTARRRAPRRARALPGARARDPGRRVGPDPQHGDRRRQHPAAHALRLFLRRRGRAATSARPARAATRSTGFNRDPRDSGRIAACVATHPSDMCVALAALDADGASARARAASARCRFDRSAPPARGPAGHRDELDAGRADHRDRAAARCPPRRAPPIARCATGRATRSRWSRWRPRSSVEDGTIESTCGSRSAASRTSRGGPGRRKRRSARPARQRRELSRRRGGGARRRRAASRQRVQDRARQAHHRRRARASWRETAMSIIDRKQPRCAQTLKKAIALAPDSWMPGGKPDPLIQRQHGYRQAGLAHRRPAEGARAQARFAAEFPLEGMVYAALAFSTVAQGPHRTLDTAAAEAAPGVVLVMTHENAPRMKPHAAVHDRARRPPAASDLPIMQDDRIHWNGQPIAVVLAETQEQADHAASLVRVDLRGASPPPPPSRRRRRRAPSPDMSMGEPLKLEIGDAEAALAAAPHQGRRHLPHAAPQPQRHRAACGHAGLGGRRAAQSTTPSQAVAHYRLDRWPGVRHRRDTGARHLALRRRRVRRQGRCGSHQVLARRRHEARAAAGAHRAVARRRVPDRSAGAP